MNFDSDFAVQPSPSQPSRPRPRPLSPLDQIAAQTVLSAKRMVANVFADPLLRASLFDRGYDDAEIRTGEALQAAAEAEFINCQLARGSRDLAADAFSTAWMTTREEYVEFRGLVRSLFDEAVCANTFRVEGRVAQGLSEFVAQALTSYAMAIGNASLAERGFDAARLCAATAELKQLLELDARVRTIDAALERRLDNRELAVAMYNVWVRELIQQVRLVSGIALHPPRLDEIPAAKSIGLARIRSDSGPRFGWDR